MSRCCGVFRCRRHLAIPTKTPTKSPTVPFCSKNCQTSLEPFGNTAAQAAAAVLGGGRLPPPPRRAQRMPPPSCQEWGSPPHSLLLLSSSSTMATPLTLHHCERGWQRWRWRRAPAGAGRLPNRPLPRLLPPLTAKPTPSPFLPCRGASRRNRVPAQAGCAPTRPLPALPPGARRGSAMRIPAAGPRGANRQPWPCGGGCGGCRSWRPLPAGPPRGMRSNGYWAGGYPPPCHHRWH